MIIGVSVTRPAALMTSISKRINFWPIVTWSPWATRLSKPLPSRPTVSIPMWMSNSTPSSETIPMACLVGKRTVTVPLTGEVNSPWLGSMTRPCPITPDAKTGSVAWLNSFTWPASGLTISTEARVAGSWVTNSASSWATNSACKAVSSSVFVKRPTLRKKKVKSIGTTIATSMVPANGSMYWGWIERIPGRPPIPIEAAVTLKVTDNIPARAEPIIPATNG